MEVENALKQVRKVEANKFCFECEERGPQYADMDHGTLVCTTCAGYLRELQFRIKGLSMATFTMDEVNQLKAGNETAGGLIVISTGQVFFSRAERDEMRHVY